MACPNVLTHTEAKANKRNWLQDLNQILYESTDLIYRNFGEENTPTFAKIEFKDSKHKEWYMDPWERSNAFNFNKFNGWECSAG